MTGAINLARAEKLASLGHWDWDLTTNDVKWSDGHFRIFGYPVSPGNETYEMFRSRVHPDDVIAVERALREGIEKGTGYNFDYRLKWPDGSIRHIHAEADRPVKDASGKPVRWFGIVQDVTEHKQAEKALKESEERFRAFMDNSPAIAWMKDAEGRHVYLNKTYEEEFGVRLEDWRGKTDFELWSPETADQFRKNDLDVLVCGRTASVVEEIIGKDGSKSYWFNIKFPLRDASGNMYVGGIGVDITRQKQTEEALKEAKDRNELYVDLMGHDINNINQVAMGYLELAADALSLDNGDKELIEKPLEALRSSVRLIENVQKLKKLDGGGLRAEAIDLNKVLLEMKTQYTESNGKNVVINYEPEPYCRVMANGLLNDVFSNLIINSIKHSDPQQPLTINIGLEQVTEKETKYYKVIVEDDGPGIPDNLKNRLFIRFQRGQTKAIGKGLGLYLVHTLVNDFHGKIWVEDRMQGDHTKGARFVIMLPAVEK